MRLAATGRVWRGLIRVAAALAALAALVAWQLLLAPAAVAAEYYVDPINGEDSASGHQPASAFRTLARINSLDLEPGDCVLLRAGSAVVHAGPLLLSAQDSGTAEHPVVITSYGSGRAVIDAGDNRGFEAVNCAGIELRNLVFRGSGTTNTAAGVGFWMNIPDGVKLPYLRLHNLEVSGFGDVGVYIGANGSKHSGYRDIRMTGCEVHHCRRDGMFTWGVWELPRRGYALEEVYVGDCSFHDNPGRSGKNEGSGIYLKDVDRGVIEYCHSYNNGAVGGATGGPVGIWAIESNAITIQHNESDHNYSKTVDGGGFDLDGGVTNSVLQYNYSHDNRGTGFLLYQYSGASRTHSGNTVRYNISDQDGGGLEIGGGTIRGLDLYHNVVVSRVGSRAPLYLYSGDALNVRVLNNIFIANGMPLINITKSFSGISLMGNGWWSPDTRCRYRWAGVEYSSLAALRAATGQERQADGTSMGIEANPLFAGMYSGETIGDPRRLCELTAFRLLPDSPMINSGLDLRAVLSLNPGTCDFFGTPLPSSGPSDTGAYRYAVSEPQNLTATTGNARVTLSWNAVSDAVGYAIYRRTAPDGLYTRIADSLIGTTFADTTSSNGTTYAYVVTARTTARESDRSNEALATPIQPTPVAVIVDNSETGRVSITGAWTASTHAAGYWGGNYLQDQNKDKGTKSIRFKPYLAAAGAYEVFLRWSAATNRASNVPIEILHGDGTSARVVNQRTQGGQWVSIGVYKFTVGTAGQVTIRTNGTNGYVIADAVRFVPAP